MYHFVPKLRADAGGREGAGVIQSACLITDGRRFKIVRGAAVCGK
jgi:hypothetical protein